MASKTDNSRVNKRPYYRLNIYIKPDDPNMEKYKDTAYKKSKEVVYYLSNNVIHCDAGYDLHNPRNDIVEGLTTYKLNYNIRCSMEFINEKGEVTPCGYYLVSRSSTGTKTPLRLANQIGIIDMGYRGDIMAVFDNWKTDNFNIIEGERYVQIIPSNLNYPMAVNIVDSEKLLGETKRGTGGFGSTGK